VDAGRRAHVAYLVAVAMGRPGNNIYDQTRGRFVTFSGGIDGGRISIYDQSRGSYLIGTSEHGKYELSDTQDGCRVSLSISAPEFSGFDHCSASHFTGTLSSNTVSIYDLEHNAYFHYFLT
jgi:hypothetical protein